MIPNYARRRAGQAISTAFIESLVTLLLSKRFAKKQSIPWTPEGAHLTLLVGRGRVASAEEREFGPVHVGAHVDCNSGSDVAATARTQPQRPDFEIDLSAPRRATIPSCGGRLLVEPLVEWEVMG